MWLISHMQDCAAGEREAHLKLAIVVPSSAVDAMIQNAPFSGVFVSL